MGRTFARFLINSPYCVDCLLESGSSPSPAPARVPPVADGGAVSSLGATSIEIVGAECVCSPAHEPPFSWEASLKRVQRRSMPTPRKSVSLKPNPTSAGRYAHASTGDDLRNAVPPGARFENIGRARSLMRARRIHIKQLEVVDFIGLRQDRL